MDYTYTALLQKKQKKTYTLWLLWFIFGLSFAALFIPQQTLAFSDARCFEEKECKNLVVKAFGDPSSSFVQSDESASACGGTSVQRSDGPTKVGFCLAAGMTKTQIKIGGRDRFENITDFIQYVYKYGIILGGLLAVMVIIVAGLQLTVSGGHSGIIESAKKRLGGAIIGLVILVLSYTILDTINPATLNLRLPSVYMLREIHISPERCDETKDTKLIYALVATQNDYLRLTKKPEKLQEAIKKTKNSMVKNDGSTTATPTLLSPKSTECGSRYTKEDMAGLCIGSKCTNGVCGEDISKRGKDGEFTCYENSDFYLYFYDGGLLPQCSISILEDWCYTKDEKGWINDDQGVENKLYYFCKKGPNCSTYSLGTANVYPKRCSTKNPIGYNKQTIVKNDKKRITLVPLNIKKAIDEAKAVCKGEGNEPRFAFRISIIENEAELISGTSWTYDANDDHFIGKNGIDLGDADFFSRYYTKERFFPYLLTEEDLLPGDKNFTGLRIDVSNIVDLDTFDEGLKKAIAHFGYLGLSQQNIDNINQDEIDAAVSAVSL